MISLGSGRYFSKVNTNIVMARQLLFTAKGQWEMSHILIPTNPTNYVKLTSYKEKGLPPQLKNFFRIRPLTGRESLTPDRFCRMNVEWPTFSQI